MLLALIFTLVPTMVIYVLLSRLAFLKSGYLRLAFSWFLGQYILTIIAFISACVLSFFTTTVLQKASYVAIVFYIVLLTVFYNEEIQLIKQWYAGIKKYTIRIFSKNNWKILFLLVCLLFSFLFFHNQLRLQNATILTSPAYWDFQWHMPLIQNFAYGDNFPPQNESFAGVPETYHFFWGVNVAVYSVVGLDLVSAINYVSILSLFFLLLAIAGFTEDIFKSFTAGTFAVLLTITTSSFHFLNYIAAQTNRNPLHILLSLLTNTAHPYVNSFVNYDTGLPFGYNGPMFNMFYFLAERQIIFGMIFLIFAVWIIYQRKHFKVWQLLLLGSLMGLYFLWHIYITIMVFCPLLFVLIFDNNRKKTLLLLGSFGVIFLLHYLYFKQVERSVWFLPDIASYPRMNFNFPTRDNTYPLSISNAIMYYVYAYGLKIPVLLFGLWLLWRKHKKAFIATTAIIIPTFILVNTIQLSPLSVYDNHKWLRPMNIIVDIVCGYALYKMFVYKNWIYRVTAIVLIIFLTLSGLIELPPFLNAQPTQVFALYNSPIVKDLRQHTPPQSVFIGNDAKQIQLAGRKLFLGDYSGQDLRLDKDRRQGIIDALYVSDALETFCNITQQYGINYVEFDKSISNPKLHAIIEVLPHITSKNDGGEPVMFADIKKDCSNY